MYKALNYRIICLSLLLLIAGGAPLAAQGTNAQIGGTVTDSTGAAIASASITVTNAGTGVSRNSQTNEAGVYLVNALLPGSYQLTVAKEGFQKSVSQTIRLDVNQAATFDVKLALGRLAESVVVTASGELLNTTEAQLGTVITQEKITDLPLNGRNFTQLLTLTPGATPVSVAQNAGGGNVQKIGNFVFPAVGGQSNRSNTFTLDGVYNDSNWQSTYAIAPSIDAIAEFKVQSHSDQAEFGGVSGGVVNIATKSGTNTFHGSAYEFLRNDALDARGFFSPRKAPLRQNQFGATLGGPILKNKTFFFFSYEGYRQTDQASRLYIVPTPAQLGGDFRGSKPIYDPFTTTLDPANPGRYRRDPFTGNQIPASLISPAIQAWSKAVIPAPVATGNPAFNGLNTTPQSAPANQYSIRVDHNFSASDFAWFRYTTGTQDQNLANTVQGALTTNHIPARNAGSGYTHVFSPTTVFTGLFGYTALEADTVPFLSSGNLFDSAPFKGFPSRPGLNAPGITLPSAFGGLGSRVDYLGPATGFQGRGDLSYVRGRHTMKFGFGYLNQLFYDDTYDGNFTFNSLQTANLNSPGSTGLDVASFVLGAPSAWEYRNRTYAYASQTLNAYAEDSWKATGRLTVNIGLRWDLLRMPSFTTNFPSTWDYNAGRFIVGSVAPPECGSGQFAPCLPDPNNPYLAQHVVFTDSTRIRQNDYKMFGPRLGLAYRLDNSTALRAGFGIFYDLQAGLMQQAQNASGGWPRADLIRGVNINNPLITSKVDDTFNGADPRVPAPTPAGVQAFFFDPNFQNPYSEQWNFELQRTFGRSFTASAAYVGSHNSRLPIGGFYNTAVTPGPGLVSSRALYPYAPASNYDRSIGRSNYNALQAKFEQRVSHGLSFLVAYTWSKSIDIASSGQFGVEGQSLQDPYHVDADRAVSAYDIPQYLAVSAVYTLPFGHGRQWLTTGFASRIFGNWQLNSIVQLRSGQPYSLSMNTDVANIGAATTRPDLVGDPTLAHPSSQEWFNTGAYASPAVYHFGTSGRNQLRTQGFRNVDLSLFRQDQITERLKSEFRVEAFNLTNTATFGTPNTNFTSPAFGVVSSTVSTARQIQLGLKLIF
ncbi:MAG TPA: carboxypeptidase regulatory-like domain-containing protein [Bryobacteraceae bacterium]